MALKLLELEVDMTFETHKAKKHDGYLTVSGYTVEPSAYELSPNSVFPWGPPIDCSLQSLFTMETPPAHRAECDNMVVSFKNGWIPLGALTETSQSIAARGKRAALALTRMHRQETMKDAVSNHQETMSEAFRWLVGLTCVIGVVAIVITGILFLKQGSPL